MSQQEMRTGAPQVTVGDESVFARAARIFDGWTDPETGARVLRIRPPNIEWKPGCLTTVYQQTRCFLDGGRRVLMYARLSPGKPSCVLLDLASGEIANPFPDGYGVMDVDDGSGYALLLGSDRVAIHDLLAGRELASLPNGDWKYGGCSLLPDGRRAVVSHYQGKFYDEHCRTRLLLLSPGAEARVFLELDGFYGNHMQGCPTEPDLFCYNAWPTPLRYIDGVASIASVDGKVNYYLPLDEHAPRPGDFWGVRDHYVWTPDGTRLVSYLNRQPLDRSIPFNHFPFDWWLSALDWRTGEDYCVQYPPHRWGGHMQMTPDSRHIVCAGGPGFDKLYAVELAALRDGWNEHIICGYPATNAEGVNTHSCFAYPFVLPDGSGVIFNAGWWGEQQGVYLAEWPAGLR